MRRFTFLPLLLVASCHRTQPPPAPAVAADAATGAVAPADSGDPSVLSRAPDTNAQIQPHLVVAPDGTVATAWMSTRTNGAAVIGYRVSHDGGTTWEAVQTIAAPEDRWASNPVVAADGAGSLYLAYLGSRPQGDGGPARDTRVYVARAAPGTAGLGPPVDVTDPIKRGTTVEKLWMAVTGAGAVLVTWSYSNPNGDGIRVARSPDGVKWSQAVVIERIGLEATLPYVCPSTNGDRVWITYLDSEAGVRVRASDDGGAYWSPGRVATVSSPEERTHLAGEEPVCVGDKDHVTIAYGRSKEARDGARSAVFDSLVVATSYDGGRTFDMRRTIDLPPNAAMHPQMTREPEGAIDLGYYAAGATPESGSLRWVRAVDDKSPFSASKVAREGFHFARTRTDSAWPGDYFGWAFRDKTLYAASIDNSGEMPHVAFTRIPVR